MQIITEMDQAVEWDLVWAKGLAFTSNMSSVAWGRYQGVYLDSLGCSVAANGVLRACGLLAKFGATPAWAALADTPRWRHRPTALLALSVVGCCLLFDGYRWPAITASTARLAALKLLRSGLNGVGVLADVTILR